MAQTGIYGLGLIGPSGAGKSTLVRKLVTTYPDRFECSISDTTRPKGENEIQGVHYNFIGKRKCERRIKIDYYLEWEQVYNNDYYGTPINEVHRIIALNKIPVFDIDIKGARRITKHSKERLGFEFNFKTIYLHVPIDELERRLRERKRGESEAKITERLKRAELENKMSENCSIIIPNNNLDEAFAKIVDFISPMLQIKSDIKIAV